MKKTITREEYLHLRDHVTLGQFLTGQLNATIECCCELLDLDVEQELDGGGVLDAFVPGRRFDDILDSVGITIEGD